MRRLLPFLPVLLQAQAVSFLPPTSVYQSGSSGGSSICSTCFAIADFNSDGRPDLVFSGSTLTPFAGVLLGNGDGSFRTTQPFDLLRLSGPAPLTVGDFNGDGRPDVAFANSAAGLYLGKGDGTFSGPTPLPSCGDALVLAADIDRDNKQDLICGSAVFLSKGDGTFSPGPALDGTALLACDLNGDQIPDLILSNAAHKLYVAPGKGDGTFQPSVYIVGSDNLQSPVAGDFNRDGFADLVGWGQRAGFSGYYLTVLSGRGDGSFGPPLTGPAYMSAPDRISVVADLNGDGTPDLIAGSYVYRGNGNGTFNPPIFLGIAAQSCNPNYNSPSVGGIGCTYTQTASAAADLNNDGLPDFISGYVSDVFAGRKQAFISVMINDSPGDGLTSAGLPVAGVSPVGAGSVFAAYGTNLASRATAAGNYPFGPLPDPLPTTLADIRVHVRDRSHPTDTLAPLLYASPTQINYVLASTDPFAWVSIEHVGQAFVAKGVAVPLSFKPSLNNYNGLAAASAIRINADGSQTPVAVSNCAGPFCGSIPIDVTAGSVYLSLYGYGFDTAAASQSQCQIADQTVRAVYVGPQGTVNGLDQINVLLPPTLAGKGSVTFSCTFGFTFSTATFETNRVTVTFR